MKRHRVNQSGFTLVELMVVIAIIMLLVSLVTPAVTRGMDRVRKAACVNNHHQLHAALMLYCADNDGWTIGAPLTFRLVNGQIRAVNQNFTLGMAGGVQYRGFWYTGGGGRWDRLGHPQQNLKEYLDPRSSVWMCPGWKRSDLVLSENSEVVGTPTDLTSTRYPPTMANVGTGYNYRPWHRKLFQWPGYDRMILRPSGPAQPTAADLWACLGFDSTLVELRRAPHDDRTSWNVSYLDGSVRSTQGLLQGDRHMLGNYPPQGGHADWTR